MEIINEYLCFLNANILDWQHSLNAIAGPYPNTAIDYKYDGMGRITQTTETLPNKSFVTKQEYDSYGNIAKII